MPGSRIVPKAKIKVYTRSFNRMNDLFKRNSMDTGFRILFAFRMTTHPHYLMKLASQTYHIKFNHVFVFSIHMRMFFFEMSGNCL